MKMILKKHYKIENMEDSESYHLVGLSVSECHTSLAGKLL